MCVCAHGRYSLHIGVCRDSIGILYGVSSIYGVCMGCTGLYKDYVGIVWGIGTLPQKRAIKLKRKLKRKWRGVFC